MKFYLLKFSVLLLLIVGYHTSYCQTTTASEKRDKTKAKSYFYLGLNFISDAVYMGRKDSISAPYAFPSITYYNKTGLYATGSLSYLTKSNESRIDLFLGTLGYEITTEKFRGDLSVTKYFFNTDSYNVISEVEADITASAGYDFDVIDVSLALTTFFNNNSSSDFILSSEISHNFITKKRDFQISPTVGVFLGSQNFYEEYYINNRFGSQRSQGSSSGQGPGGSTTPTTTTVVLNESEKFGLMAFEFSIPMWYVARPFILSFLPVLVVPQNPASLTVDSTVFEEDLENTFYWMVGVSYKFN
ncbi:hypothetical protein ACFQ0R_00045 [Psychroflexus salinarum]|uniref:Outer membrane protein beta-barrel domain-containing protein n=1 Tax=Psychroflexus salinarum TaxID=546024 RepID=A0ABW3GKM5_9FLAO